MLKLSYKPGNLLQEYSYSPKRKEYKLEGLFLITKMDEFGVSVVSMYDKDGCYNPSSRFEISHDDLHKNSRFFKWVIQ
jgi:hypothetical protein